MNPKFSIDPVHEEIDLFSQVVTLDVWRDKYRDGSEKHPFESFLRVVKGVYRDDLQLHADNAYLAMKAGLWVPAGRIQAGAGTTKVVTWINCYVSRTIQDSMVGIMDALKEAALTQQQGGGIGMNFSTLRPTGAYLHRTGAVASGPLPFMDMWHSMCGTIMSAGSRRGAMMGVMADWHPDLLKFIEAKRMKGRLTNFNVSVLVSDAFMAAVEEDEEWVLHFPVKPAEGNNLGSFLDEEGIEQYIYAVHRARDLWERITANTYEYSEPGVIFIDRVNDLNNLYYCEHIDATNPCGEQPLPPWGACNLGAVNLARMVDRPFKPEAKFNFGLLAEATKIGVRFLDNVIDQTPYPLAEQQLEQQRKRRIGLGVMGLADAMVMLGHRYGSDTSIRMTQAIMQYLALEAYTASFHLGRERGTFPLWNREKFASAHFVQKIVTAGAPQEILEVGTRNGVLLTIAPTGTTTILMGNTSGGCEPVFAWETKRKVLQPDNSFKDYRVLNYAKKVYEHLGSPTLPRDKMEAFVTAQELEVRDHLRIQAACQEWVDASISKTINIPKNYSKQAFQEVYDVAYEMGLKGCTTYRPSDIRGSILEDASKDVPEAEHKVFVEPPMERPDVLQGHTYKVRWPHLNAPVYVTINDYNGKPWEMFVASRSSKNLEWVTALMLMISAIMRRGGDISFVPNELMRIVSTHETAMIQGKFYGSLPALLGKILAEHMTAKGMTVPEEAPMTGEICPDCEAPALQMQEGCKKCLNCGYSSC